MAEYLTASQIAELLQVSEKSVYRWAALDPTFPMLRIGGAVPFPRERMARGLRPHQEGGGEAEGRKRVPGAKAKSGKEGGGAVNPVPFAWPGRARRGREVPSWSGG